MSYKIQYLKGKWVLVRPDGETIDTFPTQQAAEQRKKMLETLFQATADSTDSTQRSSPHQSTEHENP